MWTLDNALPLIRRISPIARRHGFALALYGSVLDKGESEKDLDLFFIRREHDSCDVTTVRLKVEQNQLVGVLEEICLQIERLKCLQNGRFLEKGYTQNL
jgi:hypothetical protein